jgi:LysR family transcriptional regulator, glycine cleavage system transcriptional activator
MTKANAGRSDARFPSIDALRALEAAARLGSFDAAANELSITASALSKRMTSLEELIGTSLFDRQGRAVQLTASGKEYAQQVRGVLAQLASIGLHSRQAQSVSRVRVLAPPTFAREILLPRLKAFTDKNPNCEIEIVVAIPYLDRELPEADVVIGFGQLGPQNALLSEPVFAVAAPGFAKKHSLKAPKDLRREQSKVALLRCPLEPWAPWFSALGLAAFEPNTGLKLVDLGLMLEAAAQGHGVALARANIVASWIDAGRLAPLFPGIKVDSTEGYSLSVNQTSAHSLEFAQWLRRTCAKLERSSLI